MTAPEPLRLTLAEANEQALADGCAIVPSGNGRQPWELARVGRTGARFYTWEEAASAALGRPVVERDDTAELVELLARMTHTVRSLYQNTPPAGDDAEVLGLITAAEAVLALARSGER